MEYYVEKADPDRDLGGLCECFVTRDEGRHAVARAHVHQHFELLFCLEGGYELLSDRESVALCRGDVALIHPMQPHQTRSMNEGANSYLVLKFTPDALYSASQPSREMKTIFPYIHFSGRRCDTYEAAQLKDSGLPELLLKILSERQRQEFGYEMAVRAYVSQVLLWFIRAWNRQRDAAAIDERTLARLQTAMRYIEEHLDESLNIGEVAARLSLGESTFSRFFAKATGTTFPAYVRSLRLGRAAALLINSERSVTDVALETGFASASYLILCFRRQYGMTPAKFRTLYGRSAPDADRERADEIEG